jgi:MSHA biogenesis protein MshP
MTLRIATRCHHQRGFSLVVAIFIIVVLALLGVAMVTIGTMERATAAAAAQGARAYHAARAGIEWGIFQTVAPAALGGPLRDCPLAGAPSGDFSLAVTGLNGFDVSVSCTQTLHQEHGAPFRVVFITSVATYGSFGSADYVSRTLQATVTDAAAP